jgi:hypothetical protein
MKIKSLITSALFIPAVCFFAGCQKEAVPSPGSSLAATKNVQADRPAPQTHQLKGEFLTGYYNFIPDMAAGYVPPNPTPAWYPAVVTEAHLNLLGKCQAFINMYATVGPSGLQGVPASLNPVFATQLSAYGISLPDTVAIAYFDKQGNSIWARGTGAFPLTPVSPTSVTFRGNADILGGTGKFLNATGSFVFYGYFNPQDTKDAKWNITEGTITY